MIASINDDGDGQSGGGGGGGRQQSSSTTRRNRNNANATSPQLAAPVDMLQNMNTSRTAASLLLEDSSENKVDSFRVLAAQSSAARSLLQPLQSNAPTIEFNRENIINSLKLMGNIYDNTIEIIDTA